MSNLISAYSSEPVLHTYSAYNQQYDFKKRQFNSDQIIAALERKEQETYQLFGVNNYEDFINVIRGFFNINEADKQAILFFRNDNIMKKVKEWRNQQLEEDKQDKSWEFSLTIDVSQFHDGIYTAQQQFEKLLSDKYAQIDNDQFSITRTMTGPQVKFDIKVPQLNIKNLKQVIDKLYGTNFWYRSKSKTVGTSSAKGSLNDFFSEKESQGLLEWTGASDTNTLYFEYTDPLSFKKEKVKSLNKDDIRAVDEGMEKLYQWLKQSIEYDALSIEMQKAFDQVWKVNFRSHLDAAFFMKGGTSQSISGAFGEFQGLLLTNYFLYKNVNGLKVSKSYLSKVDDIFKTGESGRSDISFYKKIGLQVKNYSSSTVNHFTENLKTTQYLGELEKHYFKDEPGLSDMPQFLANYFFNSTFASNAAMQFKELTDDILPDYFAEIANFDLDDGNRDRNSFYLIEGQYLVPVSDIYKAVFNNIIEHSVSITSSFSNEIKSDEDFAKLPKSYHAAEQSRKRKSLAKQQGGTSLYNLYWRYSGANVDSEKGVPTKLNRDTYKKIISKGISIRTSFQRKPFSSTNRYRIY